MKQTNKKESVERKIDNSLRQGDASRRNIFRIMIASKGHLIGYEDVINGRPHTTTATCIS
jgi:hypothetical protein